jgi:hypothetical protein
MTGRYLGNVREGRGGRWGMNYHLVTRPRLGVFVAAAMVAVAVAAINGAAARFMRGTRGCAIVEARRRWGDGLEFMVARTWMFGMVGRSLCCVDSIRWCEMASLQ